jgi:PTS system N-acetylglucosamine-specific IIA component
VTTSVPGGGLLVRAPVPGRALPLRRVPDPVFAAGMVGPGAALDPPPGTLDAVAPVGGLLVKVHAHAFVIQPENGPAILVHLGIDTVQLRGEGFTVRGEEGTEVQPGDVIVTWDPSEVTAGGRSPVCPVVALDVDAVTPVDAVERGDLLPALAPLFTVPLAVPISPP